MKRTVRQQEIVESARRIITLKGMENLTIRQLAQDLQLTEGAIYRHFCSKNEIILWLIEDIDQILSGAIQIGLKERGDVIKKLKCVFSSHLSFIEKRRGVSFSIINETINIKDKRLQKHMLDVIEKYLKGIEDMLIQGIQQKLFKNAVDTKSASISFFGMVQSIVTLWALNDYKRSILTKHMPNLFDLYIGGLLKGSVSKRTQAKIK